MAKSSSTSRPLSSSSSSTRRAAVTSPSPSPVPPTPLHPSGGSDAGWDADFDMAGGSGSSSFRMYTIEEVESACSAVERRINEIAENTIIHHDRVSGSSSSNSGSSATLSSSSTKFIPLQRLSARHERAREGLENIKRSVHQRVGFVGEGNTGKSHMTNDFLTDNLLSQHYKETEASSARTLDDSHEKPQARRLFPAACGEQHADRITNRPTVFKPTLGPVRVKRMVHTKDELQALLEKQSNTKNKVALLEELSTLPDDSSMFQQRVLYEDATFTNCWDAFKAATQAIDKEEAVATNPTAADANRRDLQYLAWSHIEYEGPWGNLYEQLDRPGTHIEWWDLPGITDKNEIHRLLSYHFACQLHVVLLVTHARIPLAEDITRLQALLNRPLVQVPQVIHIFNAGKQMLNDWFRFVQKAGGVAAYYDKPEQPDGSVGHSMRDDIKRVLLSQQNTDTVCPALRGNHRLAIFRTLSESCTTIMLYGRDKWRQLDEAGLLNDLKAIKPPSRAGNAALIAQLKQCQSRRITQALLGPLVLLISVLENAKQLISQRGRLDRANITGAAAEQLIQDLQRVAFGSPLPWSAAVGSVSGWLDNNEEAWTSELRVSILLFKRNRYDRAAFVSRLLTLSLGRGAQVDGFISVEAGRDVTKRLLRPLLRSRIHHSCRATFLALHVLLYNRGDRVDARVLDEEGKKHAALIDDQLQTFEEESEGNQADEVEREDSTEHMDALKGRGALAPDVQDTMYHELCRTAYLNSCKIAEEVLEQVGSDDWMQQLVPRLFEAQVRERAHAICKMAVKFDDSVVRPAALASESTSELPLRHLEETVANVKQELTLVMQTALLAIETTKSPKRKQQSRVVRELLEGNQWSLAYKDLLLAATAEMEETNAKKHQRRIKELRDKLSRGLTSSTTTAARVPWSEQPTFLLEEPRLLERVSTAWPRSDEQSDQPGGEPELMVPVPLMPDATVILARDLRLPQREPGDHPPVFTVPPMSIKFINPSSIGQLKGKQKPTAVPTLGGSSMRDFFESHPSMMTHEKRVLLEFQDNQPASRKMRLVAYSGLLDDLERCLRASQSESELTRGVAPLFIPSKGRAGNYPNKKMNRAKAHIDKLEDDTALGLAHHPDSLVFVMVEREEAQFYFESFAPSKNIVCVVIPGSNRGIRFVRSCIVYLATCLRHALTKQKPSCPPFDFFHTLDDDWRHPRVFDPTLIGEQCMRPCSLFMLLRYAERIMDAEQKKHDGRNDLLKPAEKGRKPPEWQELVSEAADKYGDEDIVPIRNLLEQNAEAIKRMADQATIHPCLKKYADVLPRFKDDFLRMLREKKNTGQRVGQVSATHRNITALRNDNCKHIGASEKGENAHPHYRVSADRRGYALHNLPIYLRERVNYLSDVDFFLSQGQVDSRLRRLSDFNEWFRNDRHFIREVLEPRGVGGMVMFKFDIDFARVRSGGLFAIPTRRQSTSAAGHSKGEDKHDEESINDWEAEGRKGQEKEGEGKEAEWQSSSNKRRNGSSTKQKSPTSQQQQDAKINKDDRSAPAIAEAPVQQFNRKRQLKLEHSPQGTQASKRSKAKE